MTWVFTLMLIADTGLDFWPAMELSRKVVSRRWWKFLWFLIVLGAIELAGILLCLIGFFVAAPIALAALAYAYEDIFGSAVAASRSEAAGAGAAQQRSGSNWGAAIGIIAGAVATVLLVAFLGLLAAIAIPNFIKGRHHAQQAAAEQWTQQGWQLWQAHKLDEAAAKFRQAVKLEPDDADAWNGLGWATFNAGKSREAEKAFHKAISFDPNQPGALNGLGQIYLSQRKYDQAEAYLLKAAPKAPAAWYGLARLYLLEGKFEQAEKYAQNIVDSGQADEIARKMLEAAKQKHLSEGLRLMIEPPAARPPANSGSEPAASAETWSPTPLPGGTVDLQKILQEAQDLMAQGRCEEALQRLIWYHNHSRSDPAQAGVRNSFALSYWVELGRRYPKAQQALLEIRDRDTQEFADGHGNFDLFMEVSSINHYLGDEDATYALFNSLRQQDKPLAQQCYELVQGLLVQRNEYDLCLSYLGDPQAAFERIRQSWEQMKTWEDRQAATRQQRVEKLEAMARTNALFANGPVPFLPELPKFADKQFVDKTRQLVEILVGAGRKAEAEKIQAEAVSVLDNPRLKSAVSDALEEVRHKRVQPSSDVVPISPDESRLVIEATKFDVAHPEPGEMDWGFKCFIPPDHLASFLFVRWTNGAPSIDPGFSTYFKVGKTGGVDIPFCSLSCYRIASESGFSKLSDVERRQRLAAWGYAEAAGVTNAVRWDVNLGAGSTASQWIAMPPFHRVETRFPQVVRSGYQRVMRLVEFDGFESTGNPGRSGVELRIFLQPLQSPPIRTAPNETNRTNYISGTGLAGTMEEALNNIRNLPIDP